MGIVFAGSIVLFVRFNRRMRRDYYLKTTIKAVLKNNSSCRAEAFFHLCPGSGAVPVIEIPKERRGKNKRGLNQREPLYGRAVFQKKRQPTLAAGLKAFYHPQKALEELEKLQKHILRTISH